MGGKAENRPFERQLRPAVYRSAQLLVCALKRKREE